MTVDESRFSDSFRTAYQTAFTEYLRMCTVTSTRLVQGKQSGVEEKMSARMLTILMALEAQGLTDKEIEALEYCLLQLTRVTTATLDPIVIVQSSHVPVAYELNPNAGLFTLSGQDVDLIHGISQTLDAEFGSFTLTGQDVTFTFTQVMHYTLTADYGDFALNGQDVAFQHTVYVPPYELEGELSEAIGGLPEWTIFFEMVSSPFTTATFNLVGNGDTDSGTFTATGNVICTVYKTSNSGIAEDAGSVDFLLNGASQSSQSFVATDDVSVGAPKTYTFTGLSAGDILKAGIIEG